MKARAWVIALIMVLAVAASACTDVTIPNEPQNQDPVPGIILAPFGASEITLEPGARGANVMYFFAPVGTTPDLEFEPRSSSIIRIETPSYMMESQEDGRNKWTLVLPFEALNEGEVTVSAKVRGTVQRATFKVISKWNRG